MMRHFFPPRLVSFDLIKNLSYKILEVRQFHFMYFVMVLASVLFLCGLIISLKCSHGKEKATLVRV